MRYFGAHEVDAADGLASLVGHGFLTDNEYRALLRGRNFLWRLRNGLHLINARCEDRLLFDYQRELAKQLGYKQSEKNLAVEQMMKKYYRTVKELRLLNELLLQHFQEAILVGDTRKKLSRTRNINERFNIVGGCYLQAADAQVFARNPGAMLELFHLLQQRPELTGVRAATIRQLRANLHRIDENFRNAAANRALFLAIFRHQSGLTHALRRMNRYGVLGAFFPAFGEVVGQMQHDLFHVYTVDAHSLFVVRNLRRLMVEKHRHEFPLLSELMRHQAKRERLFLAALCHDIGKGGGRDHSIAGAEIALALCIRIGMNEYDAKFVSWLVRHHLAMSFTAQREDLSDPKVVARFAESVGDQEHLDNLYLLTVADIRGTNPQVWTAWKGQLLSDLYAAASRLLRAGLGGDSSTEATLNRRVESRQAAIIKLTDGKVSRAELQQFWAQLGRDYFLRNVPESCAWHAAEIVRAGADLPLVAVRYQREINARQVMVLAPESENLLPRITAGLDRLHLDIFDARIHQTRSGLALLIFIAAELDSATDATDYAAKLKQFLLSPPADERPVSRVISRALRQFRVPTTVAFSNATDTTYTTMEVTAQDRPGLLHHAARAILECKVRLISAKISTVGERAEDTFFITNRDGGAVDNAATRKCLTQKLKRYLTPAGDE